MLYKIITSYQFIQFISIILKDIAQFCIRKIRKTQYNLSMYCTFNIVLRRIDEHVFILYFLISNIYTNDRYL